MVIQRLPVDHHTAISEILGIDASCAKMDVPMSHMDKKSTFFIKKEKENKWGEYTDSISYVNKIS